MKTAILFLTSALFLTTSVAFGGPTVGRVDDFEDGTLQGWSSGAEVNNISSGGPLGAGDNYLQLKRPTPTNPAPFHIGAHNITTWTGDYLAAGVRAIEMDINVIEVSSGPSDLSFRIVIFGPGGAFSTRTPITVSKLVSWQHVVFGLTRSDLVLVHGSGGSWTDLGPNVDNLTATLSDVSDLLLRHDNRVNPTPIGGHPQHIFATVGIDNITASIGVAPTYDVAWTFNNAGDNSYVLELYEPNDFKFGGIGQEDPTLLLYLGERYQVTIVDDVNHPFEVIAKGANSGLDDVLLSAKPGVTGTFESSPNVGWVDNGAGTVTFTMHQFLYNAMTVPDKRPGYRGGIYVSDLRGDFDICAAPIAGDIDGDCKADFYDFALFGQDWLDNNIMP